MKKTRKWLHISIAILLTLALSACGGGKDDKGASPSASPSASASPSPSESPSPSPSASPSASASAEASPSPEASPSSAAAGENVEIKTYSEETFGTTFQYPGSWTARGDVPGTVAMFTAPLEGADDKFAENVSVIIEDLGGAAVSVEQYAESSKQQLQTVITDFKVESEEVVEDGVYNIYYTGKQGQLDLYWQQLYVIEDGFAYVFTYTSEPDSFEKFGEAAGQIIDSWTVKS